MTDVVMREQQNMSALLTRDRFYCQRPRVLRVLYVRVRQRASDLPHLWAMVHCFSAANLRGSATVPSSASCRGRASRLSDVVGSHPSAYHKLALLGGISAVVGAQPGYHHLPIAQRHWGESSLRGMARRGSAGGLTWRAGSWRSLWGGRAMLGVFHRSSGLRLGW